MSNCDDEERTYSEERRAERKAKGRRRRFPSADRKNRRLLLLPLFLPVQDLPIPRVVSLIEGFKGLRIVCGFALDKNFSLLYTLDLLCFHLCFLIYGVTPRPYPIFSSIC